MVTFGLKSPSKIGGVVYTCVILHAGRGRISAVFFVRHTKIHNVLLTKCSLVVLGFDVVDETCGGIVEYR